MGTGIGFCVDLNSDILANHKIKQVAHELAVPWAQLHFRIHRRSIVCHLVKMPYYVNTPFSTIAIDWLKKVSTT